MSKFSPAFQRDLKKHKKKSGPKEFERITEKIRRLIAESLEDCLGGTGKPEVHRYTNPPLYTRRINREHRLAYYCYDDHNLFIQCYGHT